jgi:hypothetical protein
VARDGRGLAILARLDNVFVAACLLGFGALHGHRQHLAPVASRALAAMCGVGLVLAPYLAQNAAQFGHLVPISGAIKSTFPSFHFDADKLGTMGKLAALSGAVSVALGAAVDRDRRRRVLWLGLGTGTLLHALYVAGYTQHYTFWAWYYVNGVMSAALAAAFLPGGLAARWSKAFLNRLLPVGLTIGVLLVGAARAHLKAFNPLQLGFVTVDWPINEYRWPEEFARRMKEDLPADSIVFTYDWPGALAYYSGLRILPMDGLVNDFKFNDDLLAMGARAYLCEREISYFFGLIEDNLELQTLPVDAPLYRKPAGSLSLRREDIVVRVRDVVSRPNEALPFAIWRLRCNWPLQLRLQEHIEDRRHGWPVAKQERPDHQQDDEDQRPEPYPSARVKIPSKSSEKRSGLPHDPAPPYFRDVRPTTRPFTEAIRDPGDR